MCNAALVRETLLPCGIQPALVQEAPPWSAPQSSPSVPPAERCGPRALHSPCPWAHSPHPLITVASAWQLKIKAAALDLSLAGPLEDWLPDLATLWQIFDLAMISDGLSGTTFWSPDAAWLQVFNPLDFFFLKFTTSLLNCLTFENVSVVLIPPSFFAFSSYFYFLF